VEVAHRGACNLAAALTGAFRLGPDDRVALFSSTSFDASIWETIMALANGSCLCVVDPAGRAPAEVADELRAMGVTAATFPPSFLRAVEPARLAGIRLMVAAGEACSIDLVRAFAIGERTFVNAYGPTETTVCATFARCTASMAEAPPIGGPLPNVRVHVLDRHLAPAPVGVTGDLYVGGVGLARGYRNRAGLTAERFVPDPFGGPGARLYRTGDLARRLPDGGLRYAGRVDHQVKVRGFRVELGEIEAALAALPGVREAVAAVGERRPGEAQLVAYVVPARMGAELDERALRRDLEGSLPAHMVPSVFVVMPALPLSPNGKVDRSALPDPEDIDTVAGPFSAPQSPVEELVAAIWAEALGVGRVGREDDFFEIGGHSLVAAEVLDRVRDRLGVTLRMRALFDNPVLSEFATAVQAAS
ncbi:MAG TPA: non-ribosomal peptide synthetase, partial [Candidatus Dormibacteraeota bacterium]